jgi:hypothetical protein
MHNRSCLPPLVGCTLATPPQPQRTQCLSRALSGGGFGAGGSADNVLPYPAAASSVEACRDLCENEPTCRQFVFGVRRWLGGCARLVLNVGPQYPNSCYRMNTAYSGGAASTTWTSGICFRRALPDAPAGCA